jgi:hypothetical protein
MGLFDSTSTQTNAPWQPLQPYIKQIAGRAQTLYGGGGGAAFRAPPGSGVSPMNAYTTGALQGINQTASQGNPLAGASMNTIAGMMPGGAQYNQYQQLYNQAGNPYFAQAVQNQADLLGNDIQRQVGGLGRSGSAADTGALATQIGQMRTSALSNQWNQNISNQLGILGGMSQNQLNAVQAAPGAYAQQYLPYQYQMGVGQAYQDQAQRLLSAQRQNIMQNRQAPYQSLNAYQGAITGAGSGTGTSTGSQTPSAAQFALAGATAAAPFLKYFTGL